MANRNVARHYEQRDLKARVVDSIRLAGLDPAGLTLDDLASLDEFHTLGRQATEELAELAGVRAGMRILDVGAGLGGPARLLASRYRCNISTLDLTKAYCEVSRYLTDATGLGSLVRICQGDALDLPFLDASFDLVWTQHASMNIADKFRMYEEAARVLIPRGRFAMFDVVAGEVTPAHFPVPWAEDSSISFLESSETIASLLREAGFAPVVWEELTDTVLTRFEKPVASPVVGLHVLLPDMKQRSRNHVRNIREGRVRLLRSVLVRQ
jgi:SAM-dependent methyltransferase